MLTSWHLQSGTGSTSKNIIVPILTRTRKIIWISIKKENGPL